MKYTVKELANLTSISSRTIRYYDEIDLLKPASFNSSGYRIYTSKEVGLLQQILFYRKFGVKLNKIKSIINSPSFNELEVLKKHRKKLINEKEELEVLIKNLNKTIDSKERGVIMKDDEKFEGLKRKLIDDNERKYGEEIRKKYGLETVKKTYKKLEGMSKEDYNSFNKIEEEFKSKINEAFLDGNPSSKLAQEAVDLHRQWLSFYLDNYSKDLHAGLAKMYVADERFKSYYDEDNPGVAEILKEAILIYTKK